MSCWPETVAAADRAVYGFLAATPVQGGLTDLLCCVSFAIDNEYFSKRKGLSFFCGRYFKVLGKKYEILKSILHVSFLAFLFCCTSVSFRISAKINSIVAEGCSSFLFPRTLLRARHSSSLSLNGHQVPPGRPGAPWGAVQRAMPAPAPPVRASLPIVSRSYSV